MTPRGAWLAKLDRPNSRQRALVHRVENGNLGARTLCGKEVPGQRRYLGQPDQVQCPSCQAAQKRL